MSKANELGNNTKNANNKMKPIDTIQYRHRQLRKLQQYYELLVQQ